MKSKKILWYTVFLPLSFSSVLVLGLLSFIGVLALPGLGATSAIFLGLLALGFTVAYEGEVYLQNIKGAFNKLFLKKDYFKNRLGKQYLYKNFPLEETRPQLFTDQLKDLDALEHLNHFTLNKQQKKIQKQLKFRIKMRERWLINMLFDPKSTVDHETPYLAAARKRVNGINDNLSDNPHRSTLKNLTPNQLINQVKKNNRWNYFAIIFSLLVTLGMGAGSVFLLSTQLILIPFFLTLPAAGLTAIIISLAILSGAAYGLIIYNALTDMIANSTLKHWGYKVIDALKGDSILLKIAIPVSATVLVGLAVLMTVFTMGTWWFIVKAAAQKTPVAVKGIISALTGLSAFIFNIENTFETLGLFRHWIKQKVMPSHHKHDHHHAKKPWLWQRENWLQVINPFRLYLVPVMTVVNKLMFGIHIVAESFAVDLPYFQKTVIATSFTSNLMADYHYILGHEHHDHGAIQGDANTIERYAALTKARSASAHGHSHEDNIPSLLIKYIFSFGTVLFRAAALWDSWASKLNPKEDGLRKRISYSDALLKYQGKPPRLTENVVKPERTSGFCTAAAIDNIGQWRRKLDKSWVNSAQAEQKSKDLANLEAALARNSDQQPSNTIQSALNNRYSALTVHRFYKSKAPTATESFLNEVAKAYQTSSPAA